MMTASTTYVKTAGNVYGNLGNGVIELGRFSTFSQKAALINTFRSSGFRVTCEGNDLVVTKEVA